MSSQRVLPPPPPPPTRNRTSESSGFSAISSPKPRLSPPKNSDSGGIPTPFNGNDHQKRSPGSTRSNSATDRVPPPPPPRKPPPPPPSSSRRNTALNSTSAIPPQKRRRPVPPPPPPRRRAGKPSPRMILDSSEELASKAREMFNKCLNRSIPTGNFYSGGLGAYYLLLEQSRYHMMLVDKRGNSSNSSSNAPFRCKRLLKQALEGAQSATGRFKQRSNSSNLSHQRNISLLGGEWVGSHALLAVCYRRLEDFSRLQQEQENSTDGQNAKNLSVRSRRNGLSGNGDESLSVTSPAGVLRGDNASTISSASSRGRTGASPGASLFSRRGTPKQASSRTVISASGASMRSTGTSTVATTNPRPKSERVVDRIFYRLEKVHLATDENDDNLTYYTFNSGLSEFTNNTLTSMAVSPVWNQDVLGGRAGALQTIWWLRKEFGDVNLGQDLAVSIALKILEEGLSTANSMGFQLEDDDYGESDILFWVCDSQGSHKAFLGASRGVVGILHSLLGLSNRDWELVEEHITNARGFVRNTIDIFVSARTSESSSEENLPSRELPSGISTRLCSMHKLCLYQKRTSGDAEPSFSSGNLRPRLDAPDESDTTVDWFHGATGLAMLFLEASKVFRCKEYLEEAHRLCDDIIFPRGLAEQRRRLNRNGAKSKSSSSSVRDGRTIGTSNKKGPVGLAGMAICFLQLSEFCSNEESCSVGSNIKEEGEDQTISDSGKEGASQKESLKKVWKIRAAIYAQHAYEEWVAYMKAIPTITGTGNAYSLYEGMGGLISLLWQLSLSTLPTAEDTSIIEDSIDFQMPLYGLGFVDDSDTIAEESTEPILLTYGDVSVTEVPEEILRPASPLKMPRPHRNGLPSEEVLAESRRRRATAEILAKKRAAQAEEAERIRQDQIQAEKAVEKAKRRAELESRKQAQLLARKRAMEVARQNEPETESKNEAEEKSKREALLLARKQAKERVETRRKAKEEEELAKARLEAQQKAIDEEKKRKAAEEETKKRRALAEARLRRQKKEAWLTKQRIEERKQKEEADRLRRVEELKIKEEQRKKRLEELRLRQLKAAQIAKQKEKKRLAQEAIDREKLEKELKLKEASRKKQDAERRCRLEVLKERQKKEEQALAEKKSNEELGRKSLARKALDEKEKRRLELREERIKRKKELEEEKLRKELQRALDKEVEKQRREEILRMDAEEEFKIQKAVKAITEDEFPQPSDVPPPSLSAAYSPLFAQRKSLNPTSFTVPTRSSLFWSLQSDSNIGSSESYRPALVALDTPPSSSAVSSAQD